MLVILYVTIHNIIKNMDPAWQYCITLIVNRLQKNTEISSDPNISIDCPSTHPWGGKVYYNIMMNIDREVYFESTWSHWDHPVVQWLALLPHSMKVLGWTLHVLHMSEWVPSVFSRLFTQSECVWLFVFECPSMNWWLIQYLTLRTPTPAMTLYSKVKSVHENGGEKKE